MALDGDGDDWAAGSSIYVVDPRSCCGVDFTLVLSETGDFLLRALGGLAFDDTATGSLDA